MARVLNNLLITDLSGAIGGQIVMRVRNGKSFASKFPDMSKVKPSVKQLKEKSRFAKAVGFAKSLMNNPEKKMPFKVKKGQSVYHAAISYYMTHN